MVLVIVGPILPSLTILVSVIWGWRNGTLTETTQDRYDWDFERIVSQI